MEEIVIDKDTQGQRIGTKLLKYSERILGESGVISSMLWAKNDSRVINFHQKNGFKVAEDYVVMFRKY